MAQDKVKSLYDTFVKEGYNMESEAEFRKNLADPAKRKAAYEALKKEGYQMEAYDAFETNIGYGKAPATPSPAPKSTPTTKPQADVKTTPAPAAPKPQPTPTSAPTPQATKPTQPTWKPSEQDKIRISWGRFNMLNDFREQSQARLEQAKRATMPMTKEGRKKLKAGKFQAQLAGTPTKMMGLTPNVRTAEAATAGEGQEAATNEPKPMESAQSPVPYGVRYVNGKPVTEWMLPDGSLTTDLVEADKAEYGARKVRLRNRFVDRMKQNGLDPTKQEDVQKQAMMDVHAPAQKAIAEVWEEADTKYREDKNANAEQVYGGSFPVMGRENRVVATAARDQADEVSHLKRFDLRKMEEETWRRSGATLTDNCYEMLCKERPADSKEVLRKEAEKMARGLNEMVVFNYAKEKNMPKSSLEFFARTMRDNNLLNSLSRGFARSIAGTTGDLAAEEQAMGEYGKKHRAAQVMGTVAGMAADPTMLLSGGLAGGVTRRAMGAAGKVMGKGFATSLGGRVFGATVGASANLGIYEGAKEGERQFVYGGHVNPETGENEGFSAGAVGEAAMHGAGMGVLIGPLGPLFGNVGDWAVKGVTAATKGAKTAGAAAAKAGVRAAEVVTSKLVEGTIFAIPEIRSINKMSDEDFDARYAEEYGYSEIKDEDQRKLARDKARSSERWSAWDDSMAMMMGFGAQHAVKSVPKMIASLRPISNPKTAADRAHNRKNFMERVHKSLDPAEFRDLSSVEAHRLQETLRFSKEEREELRRAGYGGLTDLFEYITVR
ncbi:MAG: hypothetical protein K2M13_07370 [Muribaculaceae bacterium]|nr:hypothetical protein [Muribaculaceae bacterium]